MRLKRQEKEEESGVKRSPKVYDIIVETKNIKDDQPLHDFDRIREKVKALGKLFSAIFIISFLIQILTCLGIEEQAKRKEIVLNQKGDDPGAYQEVNDMLITSIKAKLKMLKA